MFCSGVVVVVGLGRYKKDPAGTTLLTQDLPTPPDIRSLNYDLQKGRCWGTRLLTWDFDSPVR